MESHPRKV